MDHPEPSNCPGIGREGGEPEEEITEFVSGQKEHLTRWLECLTISGDKGDSGQPEETINSWLDSRNSNERLDLIVTLMAVPEFSQLLSQQLKKKIQTLTRYKLDEPSERLKAMKTCVLIGSRIINEVLHRQLNQQQAIACLWNAVRNRGCQFLGPAIQDEILRLVLLALEDGESLTRKVLILFVMQQLFPHYPYQSSKTAIGHVIQILYRASCFEVTKRDTESSLMRLKEEYRRYEDLRREHDTQIVSIALEAGLRITPEQWSSTLYGDYEHKSELQSIVDKLHEVKPSFAAMIEKLKKHCNENGSDGKESKESAMLKDYIIYFEQLNYFQSHCCEDEETCTSDKIAVAIDAVNFLCFMLINFLRSHKVTQDS